MKQATVLAISTLLIASIAASENDFDDEFYPPEADSELYQRVKDCKTIDLPTWKHPTRNVLEQSEFKIIKVQLCNDNKYPIFIGYSKYSLDTQPNKKLAYTLYIDLMDANANWPYALVDTGSRYISYIEPSKENGKVTGIVVESDYY